MPAVSYSATSFGWGWIASTPRWRHRPFPMIRQRCRRRVGLVCERRKIIEKCYHPVGQLHQWTIERVAEYCRRSPTDIDPNESFTSYGMDSVYALALVGDIEDRLGHSIVATAIWDHPTVNKRLTRNCKV